MCLAELKAGISLGRFHDSVSVWTTIVSFLSVWTCVKCTRWFETIPLLKNLWNIVGNSQNISPTGIFQVGVSVGCIDQINLLIFLFLLQIIHVFFLLTFVSHFSLFKCRPTQTKPVCLQARLVWRRQNGNCSFPNCSNYTNVFFRESK